MTLAERCARLPAASRRAIALLLVPGVIVAAWLVLWLPIASLYAQQVEWRNDARTLLAEATVASVRKPQLAQDLQQVQTSSLWSKFYRADESGGSAVTLQSDVAALLSQAQASAQSIAPIPSVSSQHFTKTGVRLTASMRIDQLKTFFAGAAQHPRYLRIEALKVVAPQSQLPEENAPLAVTMEISGFELKQDGTTANATLAPERVQ